MESVGIDLKELVLKASKHGANLIMRLERDGTIALSAYRNGYVIGHKIEPWAIHQSRWSQGDLFNRIVDEMMYRLNKMEITWIETGEQKC